MSEEMETIENNEVNDQSFENVKPKRTTFILVLCILSWVYVGYNLLTIVGNMSISKEETINIIDEEINKIRISPIASTVFGKDSIALMEYSKSIPSWHNTLTTVFLLLEGLAVFLIFQMKRNGFWIYLATQIGFLVQTYFYLPFPNMASTIAISLSFLIIAVFTILYAVNLKHLRN
jgi:hypothetical protein